jgi:glutathione S-transferase
VDVAAPPANVWSALTDPAVISSWLTCQDVAFEARPGGTYRLFDGDAAGTVTRAEPPRALEDTWTMGEWPHSAAPSSVRWELTPLSGGKRTRLRLTHTGFPDRPTRDAHDAGWGPNFLDKLLPWLER